MSVDWEKIVEAMPTQTGVYLMKDARGKVIYVGKAVNLRSRVRSYFKDGADNRPSVVFLRNRIADIEFILTDSEKEALILENNLIKQHHPRYNIRLRDDKDYYCLRLTANDKFPRLITLRRPKPSDEPTFGPYHSSTEMWETLKILRDAFPLRRCSPHVFRTRKRPCLNYQLKQCLAPCSTPVDEKGYAEMVETIRVILSGRGKSLFDELKQKMLKASDDMDFESAARYRDQIRAVEITIEKQKMFNTSGQGRDVIGLSRKEDRIAMARMIMREGKVVAVKTFVFNARGREDTDVLEEFILRLYENEDDVPPEIFVPTESDEFKAVEEWLSDKAGRLVHIRTPKRGEGLALVELAAKNAREAAESKLSREFDPDEVLGQLAQSLELAAPPYRIECVDISNISGKQAVGSVVAFSEAAPDKSLYRRYRIKGASEPNDYEMMREVLERRVRRGIDEDNIPDLLLLDGGKGQLNIALEVLKELAAPRIQLAAIAKDRDGKSADRIFIPGRKNHAAVPTQVLRLLQRVRDEAHRFAVEYHRNVRSKETISSELTKIPGVGVAKRNALLKHFGSLKKVKEASANEIAGARGISKSDAETIYKYFHGDGAVNS